MVPVRTQQVPCGARNCNKPLRTRAAGVCRVHPAPALAHRPAAAPPARAQGAFGEAWLCTSVATGEQVAVKLIPRPLAPQLQASILREFSVSLCL